MLFWISLTGQYDMPLPLQAALVSNAYKPNKFIYRMKKKISYLYFTTYILSVLRGKKQGKQLTMQVLEIDHLVRASGEENPFHEPVQFLS